MISKDNFKYNHALALKVRFLGWLFIGFFVSLLLASQFPVINTIITRVIAPFFTLYCFVLYLDKPQNIPPEFYLYGIFSIYCFSGVWIVKNFNAYMSFQSLILQLEVLFFCILVVLGKTKSIRYYFIAVFLIAISMLVISLFFQGNLISLLSDNQYRLDSVGANPNSVGFALLSGIFALTYLWILLKSLIVRSLLFIMLFVFSVAIVFTASRKTFITLLIFLVLWFFFCLLRESSKRPLMVIVIIIMLYAFSQLYKFAIEEAFLGERLSWYNSYQDMAKNDRIWMMASAWEFFKENPILGIGLGQFAVLSGFGYFTHSDFFEIISTTGIIGTGLYFSIYIVLWQRLSRLWKYSSSAKQKYEINLFRIFIVCLLIIGLGATIFLSLDLLSIVFAVAVYTNNWEKSLKR